MLTLCACIHRAAAADRACVYHVANYVSPLMYIIVCLYLPRHSGWSRLYSPLANYVSLLTYIIIYVYLVAYLLSPCIVARVGPFQAPYRYIHIVV